MNNQFPIKTLNQLRPVLIGFRLYKVFSILGVEITLSSISPSPFISHTEMRGAFDSTPARREKW